MTGLGRFESDRKIAGYFFGAAHGGSMPSMPMPRPASGGSIDIKSYPFPPKPIDLGPSTGPFGPGWVPPSNSPTLVKEAARQAALPGGGGSSPTPPSQGPINFPFNPLPPHGPIGPIGPMFTPPKQAPAPRNITYTGGAANPPISQPTSTIARLGQGILSLITPRNITYTQGGIRPTSSYVPPAEWRPPAITAKPMNYNPPGLITIWVKPSQTPVQPTPAVRNITYTQGGTSNSTDYSHLKPPSGPGSTGPRVKAEFPSINSLLSFLRSDVKPSVTASSKSQGTTYSGRRGRAGSPSFVKLPAANIIAATQRAVAQGATQAPKPGLIGRLKRKPMNDPKTISRPA